MNLPHGIGSAVGAGAEPALPIGESLVFFLRTAVTGGKPPALGLLPHGMEL